MAIQIPAVLTGFSTKVDGSLTIRITTNEVNNDDVLQVRSMQGQFGYFMFAPNKFNETDLPKKQAEDVSKSPSKKLKSALYVYFMQKTKNGTSSDFERYYNDYMEQRINEVKEKLV